MSCPPEFADMAQHVFALEGKTALYIEKMQLFMIAVTKVRSRVDGQGFEALATVVPTHGLPNKNREWQFGAGWPYFHATSSVVRSTYVGWRIHTEPKVMTELTEILRALPEQSTYMSDYKWQPVQGGGLVSATGTPGPIATRVQNFLRCH